MPSDTTLQEWLEEELARRGWTMAEFARRADVYQSLISNMMRGERQIGPETAKKFAAALGIGQVEMFVRAGLLDVSPTATDDEIVSAIIEEFDKMDTDTQRSALAVVRALRQDAEQRRTHDGADPPKMRRKPA